MKKMQKHFFLSVLFSCKFILFIIIIIIIIIIILFIFLTNKSL